MWCCQSRSRAYFKGCDTVFLARLSLSPRIPITHARNGYPLYLNSPLQIYTAPNEDTHTCSGNRPARSRARAAKPLRSVRAARTFRLNLSLLLRWEGRHHFWLAVVLAYTLSLTLAINTLTRRSLSAKVHGS